MNSDFSFSELTPDVIVNALDAVGYEPESGLLALNSYENRVYQFTAIDGLRYVAKFYRPQRWSEAQLLEEHQFTQELLDAEIPAVAPLKRDGTSLYQAHGYWFCVFPSAGGRAFELDSLTQLERLGRQIGRLHAVAKTASFTHRPGLDYQSFVTDSVATLQASPLLPDSLQTAFFAILEPVAERLAAVDFSQVATQRLHGDCHLGNILQRDELLTFVDFDDARTGPAIQDLWMMLNGDRDQQWLQLDTLISGYEEFCEFDETEFALIEPLRCFRIIHYMAWLARRWDDTAFRRAFPWFAEQRYWEQQILTLKEQLAVLDESPLKLSPNFGNY